MLCDGDSRDRGDASRSQGGRPGTDSPSQPWDGRWYHPLKGLEFEHTPGDSEGWGACCAAVHGVAKSRTRLSNWTTQPSEGTHPVHTLTSNFWLPELSDEKFLLFQPLHLWSFVPYHWHTNTNMGRTCLGLFYLFFKNFIYWSIFGYAGSSLLHPGFL